MNLRCRHRLSTELEIPCSARIVNDGGLVTEVRSGAGGRVDAHMAHRANDDQFLDAFFVEYLLQSGLEERIGVILHDDRLALLRSNGRMNPDTVGSWNEEGGIRIGKLVPDMEDEIAAGAGGSDDAAGVCQRRRRSRRLVAGPS